MRTELTENEVVVKEGKANLLKGINSVGGRLYLTNLRLVFESHGFAQSKAATIIDLSSIASVQECWTRLLGIVPLVPNGIAIDTTQGQEHRLALGKRGMWIGAIKSQSQEHQ
ncbi:GRAM domain-containing protein [Dehalococcoidia bacterium]|nr:GRAM domain-containing protein [Dehalococcoidia bacterium]